MSSRKSEKSSRHSKTTDVNPLTKVSSSLLVSPATEPAINDFFHNIQVATAHLLTNQQWRCVSVQTTEGLINLKAYSGWGEILFSYDSRTRLLSSAQTNHYILAFLLELCSLFEPGIGIQEWERIWFNLSTAFTNQPELHSHLLAELVRVWRQPACQLIRPAPSQNPLPSSEQHQPFKFLESLDDLTEEERNKYLDESKKHLAQLVGLDLNSNESDDPLLPDELDSQAYSFGDILGSLLSQIKAAATLAEIPDSDETDFAPDEDSLADTPKVNEDFSERLAREIYLSTRVASCLNDKFIKEQTLNYHSQFVQPFYQQRASQLAEKALNLYYQKLETLLNEQGKEAKEAKNLPHLKIHPLDNGQYQVRLRDEKKRLSKIIQHLTEIFLLTGSNQPRLSSNVEDSPWAELSVWILERMEADIEPRVLEVMSPSEFLKTFAQYFKPKEAAEFLDEAFLQLSSQLSLNSIELIDLSQKSLDELEWLLGLKSPQKLNQTFKTFLQKHDLDIFPPHQLFKATYKLINELTGLSVLDKPLKQQYKHLALLKQELTLAVPSLFKGNWEPIAAGELMSWLTIALFNPEQWKLDEPFQLVFPKQEKGNSWVQFSLSAKNQPLWTANPTIKEFFQCSDYVWVDVVKVHQIFSAYAARQSAPWNSSLILKGTDLIKLLDWVKSKDKTLSEHLTRLSNIILLLSCLQLSGNWQCDKFSVSYERSLVWQVTFDYLYSSTSFNSNSEIEELVIKLKPGTWTKYFLNRDGQKKHQALYQLAYLQKSTLKIDSYHYRLATKLALYLTVHSCSYPQGKFNILKLLERLGEDVQLLSTGKTQLWNDSLNKLKDLGWEIQLEGDNFPEPNARFIIKQPLDTEEKERLQVNKAKSSKSPLTGEQVRKARLEKGWTLKQLEAEINPSLKEQDSTKNSSAKRKRPKIQLSYSKLSKIERGQLQIQPDDEQKLRKILELPLN